MWNSVPADHKAAEQLANHKGFQKLVLNIVHFPKKIADFLVPDEEINNTVRKQIGSDEHFKTAKSKNNIK